ncbi:polycystin-1-like protein 2 isoform X2 [Ptychodera flava]|uniref:polycystin-1-like protein 2 isoform X2 n=1 Tax=Ptychodera flava TaxID=63121 RepID=UPI00396A0251
MEMLFFMSISALAFVVPATATSAPLSTLVPCRDGWIENNDKCYLFNFDDLLSWQDARASCQSTPGADLVVYDNDDEQDFINSQLMDNTYLWIGVYAAADNFNSLVYYWVNDVEVQEFNWEAGQPDNLHDNEYCVVVFGNPSKPTSNGRWRDATCRTEYSYICELDRGFQSTTPTVTNSVTIKMPETVNVTCIVNCGRGEDHVKVNPSDIILVKAYCSDCPSGVSKNYTWSLHNYNPQSQKMIDVDMSDDATSTGLKSQSISINAFKLNYGLQYYLKVVVVYSDDQGDLVWSTGEFAFTTNLPPYGGNCILSPKTGYALDTKFVISCSSWYDEGDLADRPDDDVYASTELTYSFFTMSQGSPTRTLIQNGNRTQTGGNLFGLGNLTVIARVSDKYGEYIEQNFFVQVMPSPNLAARAANLTTGKDNILDSLVSSGDVGEATTLICAVASVLNSGSTEEEDDKEAKEARSKVRSAMIDGLEKMSTGVSTTDSVGQAAKALDSVTAEPSEIKGGTQAKAATALKSVSSTFSSFDGMREQEKVGTATDITSGAGNVLTSSSTSAETMEALKVNPMSSDFDYLETEPSPEELEVEREKNKLVAESVVGAVKSAADALLKGKPAGSKPIEVKTTSLTMSLQRDRPSNLGGKKLSGGGGSFKLPSSSTMLSKRRRRDTSSSDDEDEDSVSIVMTSTSKNPFTYDTSNQLDSKVVSLELNDADGSAIPVHDLEEDILIEIDNPAVPEPETVTPVLTVDMDMYYRKLKISENNTAIRITVRPIENQNSTEALNYTVYLRYMYSPTRQEFNMSQQLPRDDFGEIPDDVGDESLREQWNYTVFIPASMINQSGDYHVGILQSPGNESEITDEPPTTQERRNITLPDFSLQITTVSCKYWDDKVDKWSKEGCQPLEWSSTTTTVCGCNHLTSFATDFFVPPNSIDFGTVFQKFANLGENASVFSTIFVIFGLYLVGVYFCRRADKKDLVKWGVLPLADNDPDHHYYYQVNVYTGTKIGSGTRSKISCTLFGSIMNSGVRNLEDAERCREMLFEKGSISKFVLACQGPLGRLRSLRIWHDNSGQGKNASWFLSRVEVVDIQTTDRYTFLCDKWLAVEKGDGRVERFLPAATDEDMVRFSQLFSFTTRKEFTDGHLWFSVMSRPNRSNFTRVQRLSCCLSLLYLTMIASCMFFRTDDEKTNQSDKLFSLGPLEFSLKELYVSVVSSLVVFPPSLLLVQLFRKSRAKPVLEVSPETPRNSVKHNKATQFDGVYDNNQAAKKYRKDGPKSAGNEKWGLFKESNSRRPLSAFQITIDDETSLNRSTKGAFSMQDEDSDYGSTVDFDFDRLTPSPRLGRSLDDSWNSSSEHLNERIIRPSSPESRKSAAKKKKKEKPPFMLPYGFVYVAWLLVFLSSFTSAFFTILYSMEWGNEKSTQWLISFFLSFFESLLLIQPAKVILIALFVALIWKKPEQIEDDVEENKLKPDEEWLGADMSAYEGIVTVDDTQVTENPISPEELERARRKRFKEVKMKGVLKEMFVYGFYLTILLLIAYGARDLMSRYEYMEMDNLFFDTPYIGKDDDPFSLEDIDTGFPTYFQYIRAIVIPSLYADKWYNGERIHWRQRRYISNHVGYRVGPARLRQLRVMPELCKGPSIMSEYVVKCDVGYDMSKTEDKTLYGESWTPINASFTEPDNAYALPWLYASADELNGGSLYGHITWYGGGGYTAEFGSTIEKAYDMVDYLERTNWLDPRTRAVILEFTVYNAQSDLFSMITLIAEFPSVGGGVAYRTIQVIRLYPFTGTFPEFLMACDVIFVIFIIFFIVEEIRQIKKEKSKYFKDYWNYLELTIIGLSLVGIGMFIYKIPTRDIAVESLHSDETGGKRAFLNLQSAALYEEIYNYVLAALVFASILKLMKLMRLNRHIALMVGTISAARKDLVNFCIVFAIVFLAFGQMCYMLFSCTLLTYSTLLRTVETLLSTLLGAFDYDEMAQAQPVLGPIVFFAFIMTSMMILLNMFITAVMMAYSTVQEDKSRFCEDYEIVDFIWDNVMEILGIDNTNQSSEVTDDCPPPYDEVNDDGKVTADSLIHAFLKKPKIILPDEDASESKSEKSKKLKINNLTKSPRQKKKGHKKHRFYRYHTTEITDDNKENDSWSIGSIVEALECRVDVLADFVDDFDEDGNKKLSSRPYTGVMHNAYDKVTKKSDVMDSGGGMLVHLPQLKVTPKIIKVLTDDMEKETGESSDVTSDRKSKKVNDTVPGPWHISGNNIHQAVNQDPRIETTNKAPDRVKGQKQPAEGEMVCKCDQSTYQVGQQMRIHLPLLSHQPNCPLSQSPGSPTNPLPRRLPPLKRL